MFITFASEKAGRYEDVNHHVLYVCGMKSPDAHNVRYDLVVAVLPVMTEATVTLNTASLLRTLPQG